MQIKDEILGGVTIVSIDDHLDTASAPPLEEHLLALIEGGERRLVVDCAALEYVNSAGLKIFLLAAKKLESLDGRLVLCTLSPGVLMVFEMVGFHRIMKIVVTREEALRSFSDPGPDVS